MSRTVSWCRASKPFDLDKDHVRETVGGVQLDLLDNPVVDRERKAAGFARRV
jgi:hypothetical protein